MTKIASTQELQDELRKIATYCGSEQPSRQVITDQLQQLAARVAGEAPNPQLAYLLGDAEDMVLRMDTTIRMMQGIMRDSKKMPVLSAPVKQAMSSLVDADRSIRYIRDILKKS